MKTLLALDVATTTGWSFGPVAADARPSLSGHIRFAREGADDAEVWKKALIWLTEQIGVLQPSVIALEAPINSASPAGGSNAQTLGRLIGLQAVLRAVVEIKLPTTAKLIHVQSARKLFIGKGNLPGKTAKKLVQERCVQLGWLSGDEVQADRADAMCVWAKAVADLCPAFAANLTPLGTSNDVQLIPPSERAL
jgi:hypothetical protein